MTAESGVGPMPDLSNATCIVTGANSGLGFAGTQLLASAGATVVMACRDGARGEAARERILADEPEATLDVRECDLADLSSIETFATAFRSSYDELSVLCNNAGVMAIPREETTDGFEMQFGVNHLGHVALTGHLLDCLRETPGESRVVTQSSKIHERGTIDFDDLHGETDYDKWGAYAQSKLANLLFAFELDRRLRHTGADVTSVGCHPGYAATNLQRRGPEKLGSRLRLAAMRVTNAVVAQSAHRGALPMVYAATAAAVDGGDYVGPDGLLNLRGLPTIQEPSDRARDEDLARRLWEVSEELTGVSYELPVSETAE